MSGTLTGAESFHENAREALADTRLRGTLHHATGLFGERRKAAVAAVPEWEALRERARQIKAEALGSLDRQLEEFEKNATAAGAVLHWARDAEEACALITGLARERGASLAVKSKSMVAEEIHLNEALAAAGVEPVETDLGEYIIQLAGEPPSHIVAPAVHKTKRDVVELFVEHLGIEETDDVAALTAAARAALRQRFAAADVGISGVNFAIAETGTILILENEGNARLTTSLPRTHIAVMGIEKVIPRFADLDVFLKVLPRASTGQQITSYQSLITGTKRSPEGEGPEELHIVILDNGRSAILGDPVMRQTLACIRCGACLNTCPVYQQIGGHAYGVTYSGPIGAVLTPQLVGIGKASQLPYASSLCGACREVCPVKIDIPRLLLHLRGRVVAEGGAAGATGDAAGAHTPPGARPLAERLAFRAYATVMSSPRLLRWATDAARLAQRVKAPRPGPAPAFASRLIPPLGAWTGWRDLRPLAPRSFRDLWQEELADEERRA